jgi:predicted alpha/beta superfamily hydrolase
MYKIASGLILFLLSVSIVFSQTDSVKVRIEVITHEFNDSSAVYIAGNHKKFGKWHPGIIRLEKEKNKWVKKFKFAPGELLEFKFTKGTWTTEALNDDSTKTSNISLDVVNDTLLTYTVNVWRKHDKVEPVFEGQVTGKIVYHRKLKKEGLKDRDAIVWLPPGYESDIDKFYPVYYMHDGQNMFDPKTSAFGIDWQMDEAADSLIKNGEIEPMIIVGITSTTNRTKEFTPSDTAQIYMDFIVNDLKPLIDKTYRTRPEREFTITGGSSAGGTISFMLLWEWNEIFSKAICMSPAFKILQIDLVSAVRSYNGEKKDIRIYFDNGGRGVDKKLLSGIDEMITVLKDKGYKEGEDYMLVFDKEAEHTESEWAKRIPGALRFLSKY